MATNCRTKDQNFINLHKTSEVWTHRLIL